MSFQHFLITTICAATFYVSAGNAQSAPTESALKTSLVSEENKESNIRAETLPHYLTSESSKRRGIPGATFHKKRFMVLSATAYAASLADMHETIRVRNEPWWYERDPLAKPIVRLPAPAYYATGLALATGVNWMSWKMGHSRRWHKLAFLPQLFSIAGNTCGFKSNYH